MTMLRVLLVLLLAAPLTAAAEPSENELPPTPERKALNKLLDAIRAADAKAAQQAYEQLTNDFPGKEIADEAAWEYACFHLRQRKVEKGQDLLLSLKRSGRKNRWVSLSLITLADVAQERGDERAMVGYLEEALKAEATPTARGLMDTLTTLQEAYIRLARHYRDKGDFKKALDYFTRWVPHSWCGTCLVEMRAEREREIILCRLHLRDHPGLVRDLFRQLRKHDRLSHFDAWVLWRLYTDAGQTVDLLRMLDTYEKERKPRPDEGQDNPPPTHQLRGLLQVQSLADKKAVPALVDLCQEKIGYGSLEVARHGMRDLIHCAAAEALGGVGGAEVEAIRAALDRRPEGTGWLIYALGRSGAPAALEALQKAAEQNRGDSYSQAQNIAYALALKGKPGKKVLKRLAEQKSKMAEAAKEWTEHKAEPAWPAPTWPRPKAGSLPKALPTP